MTRKQRGGDDAPPVPNPHPAHRRLYLAQMKLSELQPHWVVGSHWRMSDGSERFYNAGSENIWNRYGMGVSFLCPVHFKLGHSHRLAVFFENPIDGEPPEICERLWKRDGETFENMTLSPSVDASGDRFYISFQPMASTPCWHGHIRNREIV